MKSSCGPDAASRPQFADPWTRPFCFYTQHVIRNLKRTNLVYNNSLYKFHVVIYMVNIPVLTCFKFKITHLNVKCTVHHFLSSPLLTFNFYTLHHAYQITSQFLLRHVFLPPDDGFSRWWTVSVENGVWFVVHSVMHKSWLIKVKMSKFLGI